MIPKVDKVMHRLRENDFPNPHPRNIEIRKADPEMRMTDTGNSEYTRTTKTDTANQATRYNRVYKPGGAGYANAFNGTSQWTQMTNAISSGDFTWSLWFNRQAGGDASPVFFGNGATGPYLQFYPNTNSINFADGADRTRAVSYSNNVWNNLILTYESSTGQNKLYFNGTLISTITGNAGLTQQSTQYIGRYPSSTAYDYAGYIDEVNIWNRILNQTEVDIIVNDGYGRFGDTTQSPWNSGLVGGWHFDENTGTNADDFSVSGNDATLNSSTWTAGKIPTESTMQETVVWSSGDGGLPNEKGIQTFGDSSGRTSLNGEIRMNERLIICNTFTNAGINTCIDALGSEGGEVYLPEGTYTITGPINILYNNTTIRGAGYGTILDATAWTQTADVIEGNSCDYITIKDLKITAKDGAGTAFDLIDLSNCTNCLVEHCWLEGSDDDGIIASAGANDLKIRDCVFYDCDGAPVFITGENMSMIGNYITLCGDVCYVTGACCVVNDNLWYNTAGGIYFATSNTGTLCGNTFNVLTSTAVQMGGYGCSITGNTFENNKNTHTLYLGTSNHTVVGNVFHDGPNNYADIYAICNNSLIEGNVCWSATGDSEWGIYVQSGTCGNIIKGNLCRSHDTGGICLVSGLGSGNQFIDNQLIGETTPYSLGGTNYSLMHSANNNFGIGVYSPVEKLYVSGNIQATGSLIIGSGTTASYIDGTTGIYTCQGAGGITGTIDAGSKLLVSGGIIIGQTT